MPEITLHTGMKASTEDIDSATYYDAGAEDKRSREVGKPFHRVADDTLIILWKIVPKVRDPIVGEDARKVLSELERVNFPVFFVRKSSPGA